MSNNSVTIVLPTTRTDGSPLALSDIASVVLSKAVDTGSGPGAATVLQTFTSPTTATLSFTDSAPDFGATDDYSVVVTDSAGNASAAGLGSVAVPAQAPPPPVAAPSPPNVTAVFNP